MHISSSWNTSWMHKYMNDNIDLNWFDNLIDWYLFYILHSIICYGTLCFLLMDSIYAYCYFYIGFFSFMIHLFQFSFMCANMLAVLLFMSTLMYTNMFALLCCFYMSKLDVCILYTHLKNIFFLSFLLFKVCNVYSKQMPKTHRHTQVCLKVVAKYQICLYP